MLVESLIMLATLLTGETVPASGSIRGVVINASQDGGVVAGAEVALRVTVDGQLIIAGETTSDERGRFAFADIPADPDYEYLPGASWQSVHYPGPRIRLSSANRVADVRLAVRDAVQEPNPLVVRRYRIAVRPQADALQVTERLLIANPGEATYVGKVRPGQERAATLSLSIPPDFTRVTFHDEFYGRRFTVIDGKLVTDVPWTPGERELAFTYVFPRTSRTTAWQRATDLPCSDVKVYLEQDSTRADVRKAAAESANLTGQPVFAAKSLAVGDVITVPLGSGTWPLMTFARWGVLCGLLAAVVLTLWRLPVSPRGKRLAEVPAAVPEAACSLKATPPKHRRRSRTSGHPGNSRRRGRAA